MAETKQKKGISMYLIKKDTNGESVTIPVDLEYLFNELGLYTPVFFVLHTSPYTPTPHSVKTKPEPNLIDPDIRKQLIERTKAIRVSLYCPECRRETIFISDCFEGNSGTKVSFDLNRRNYDVTWIPLRCQLKPSHVFYCAFKLIYAKDDPICIIGIIKVGQSPSLADIQSSYLKEYRKYISDTDYREFNKAVGLNSHGIGAGSHVYLRRIFERQIFDAFEAKKSEAVTPDEKREFLKKNTKEKIEFLIDVLPDIIYKERGTAYSILRSPLITAKRETPDKSTGYYLKQCTSK